MRVVFFLSFFVSVSLLAAPPEPAWMESARAYSEARGGHAMVVLHEGRRIFEGYSNGGSVDRRQTLASGTKSFTGVVAAAAVEDDVLKLDDAACESLTEWNGKQIIAKERLAECLTGTEQNPAYGLTWWLRETVPDSLIRQAPILQRDMGDIVKSDWLPEDLYMAAGAGKQRLYVIPSMKLVIVRQGDLTASRGFSDTAFLDRLLRGAGGNSTPSRTTRTPSARTNPPAGSAGGGIFGRLDTDGDGKVGREEFKKLGTLGQGRLGENPALLDQIFQRLDVNKDGALSAEEMKDVGSRSGASTPGINRRRSGDPAPPASPGAGGASATSANGGPHMVREIEFRIPAERWQKTMALRVYFPEDGGPYPLIVFCAGSGGKNDTFGETSTCLASHGYVVLHTSYDFNARGGGNTELTRNRVADMVLALNSLDKLPEIQPGLKGKIDATRIGAAGHSSGAYITQLLGGATVVFDGNDTSFRDERIKAIIQFSGQGSDQQGLTKESWKNLTIPMLTLTGTRDRGAMGGDHTWKKEPFDRSQTGNKHHACYEGGHHGSFSGKFASDPQGKAIFDHSQQLALAFFDAYLKADEKSLAALKSQEPATWNDARLEYFQR